MSVETAQMDGDARHVNGGHKTAAPGQALLDPTKQKTVPVFDLSVNSLSDLMTYKSNDNGLSNSVASKVRLAAGSHFCFVTSHVPIPATTWSSFQTSEHAHAEFESALVYANHSCEPTLELAVFEPDSSGRYTSFEDGKHGPVGSQDGRHGVAGEFRVARDRDLEVGDDLTWFYPSTEYHSPRPFKCLCGARKGRCIGTQRGAKFLSEAEADRYFLNPHILRLRRTDGKHA